MERSLYDDFEEYATFKLLYQGKEKELRCKIEYSPECGVDSWYYSDDSIGENSFDFLNGYTFNGKFVSILFSEVNPSPIHNLESGGKIRYCGRISSEYLVLGGHLSEKMLFDSAVFFLPNMDYFLFELTRESNGKIKKHPILNEIKTSYGIIKFSEINLEKNHKDYAQIQFNEPCDIKDAVRFVSYCIDFLAVLRLGPWHPIKISLHQHQNENQNLIDVFPSFIIDRKTLKLSNRSVNQPSIYAYIKPLASFILTENFFSLPEKFPLLFGIIQNETSICIRHQECGNIALLFEIFSRIAKEKNAKEKNVPKNRKYQYFMKDEYCSDNLRNKIFYSLEPVSEPEEREKFKEQWSELKKDETELLNLFGRSLSRLRSAILHTEETLNLDEYSTIHLFCIKKMLILVVIGYLFSERNMAKNLIHEYQDFHLSYLQLLQNEKKD